MYVKNLLNAGTYFIPVPVGLPITLQYGATGRLQRVLYGHILETAIDISKEMLSTFLTTDIVPSEIPMKSGTAWVRGILHTDTVYNVDGVLPNDIREVILLDYADHPDKFKFYAATMDSVGAAFRNPMSNMQWLHSAKFNTLRGWVVPQDLNKNTYETLLRTAKYPFRHNYTCEYIIYEGEHYEYKMLNTEQYVVTDIKTFINPNGWVKANIYCSTADKNKSEIYCADYSEITHYRVTKSSIVVLHDGHLVDCISKDNVMPDRTITCPVCGKRYVSAISGITQCDDPHCMSTQYNNVVQMLTVLNLPIISWDEYKDLVYDKKLTCVADVFDLPQYADVNLAVKLSTIFSAIVPLTMVPDVKIFDVLCNKCNNELKTVRYYMDNPNRIISDIGISSPVLPRFIEWLSDSHNLLMFDTIVGLPQITITLKSKKFDGLPILRDKIIYLTGDFKHGMHRDIVALLESFSATIVTEFNDKVNCVVVGDLHQNIDGRVIKQARNKQVPIFEESQLFKLYSLDEDIKNNLGEDN